MVHRIWRVAHDWGQISLPPSSPSDLPPPGSRRLHPLPRPSPFPWVSSLQHADSVTTMLFSPRDRLFAPVRCSSFYVPDQSNARKRLRAGFLILTASTLTISVFSKLPPSDRQFSLEDVFSSWIRQRESFRDTFPPLSPVTFSFLCRFANNYARLDYLFFSFPRISTSTNRSIVVSKGLASRSNHYTATGLYHLLECVPFSLSLLERRRSVLLHCPGKEGSIFGVTVNRMSFSDVSLADCEKEWDVTCNNERSRRMKRARAPVTERK